MKVLEFYCSADRELHIWSRHRVSAAEAEYAVFSVTLIYRGEKKGLYEILGRTEAGRYLTLIVRNAGKGVAWLITARDMDDGERRRYARHIMH